MTDIKISQLSAITNLASTDLVVVNQDAGAGSFVSKNMTMGNLDMVRGVRYYGALAADPSSPASVDGDEYYNTVLKKKMCYDSSRSKWLSIESLTMQWGRNGFTADGSYYYGTQQLQYTATRGFYVPCNVTIVAMGYTRATTASATFVVTADGVSTAAELLSTAIKGSSMTLNVNIASGAILGVLNKAGGNTTSNVMAWILLKCRA